MVVYWEEYIVQYGDKPRVSSFKAITYNNLLSDSQSLPQKNRQRDRRKSSIQPRKAAIKLDDTIHCLA